MNDKVKNLLLAYSKLTAIEKLQFDTELEKAKRELNKGLDSESLNEHFKRTLGPLGTSVCGACGRAW